MTQKMFWLDMEMTGLDEKVHAIIEVAAVITDLEFNIIDEYEAAVHQPQSTMDLMDEWCRTTHGKSGLTDRVRTGVSLEEAEIKLIELAEKYFSPGEKIVLCGNSIGNDRRFIDKYMIRFSKKLHYRLVDVSSFKEVFREKYKIQFAKSENHRAREDVMESIAELKKYLSYVVIPSQ